MAAGTPASPPPAEARATQSPPPQQPPANGITINKQTIIWIVTAITGLFGVTGSASYFGGSQGEAETQVIVRAAVDDAVEKVHAKMEGDRKEMKVQLERVIEKQDTKLDAIGNRLTNIERSQDNMERDLRDLNK
jgi:hypothetical protein